MVGIRNVAVMSIVVSAPGKVILFGDHSVVYNRRAIAAAISLRTTLTFTQKQIAGLHLDFPDIGLDLSVSSTFLQTLASSLPMDRTLSTEPSLQINAELMEKIEQHLQSQSLVGVVKAAAAAFLYLYAYLGLQTEESSYGTYHLNSELPIGAGLGSSATVSVIIVTTLLLISGAIEQPNLANHAGRGKATLDVINKWAYTGEQCIHGTPSGVDNTVATYGKAVAFQKTEPIVPIGIPALPLLLTNTGVPRSTKTQVSNVARLRDALPNIVEPILDSMHQIALEAQTLLSSGDSCNRDKLGSLMVLNQGLLATLGVSHPAIESIITANAARGWTKLIGAGGGGCVISLLRGTDHTPSSGATETPQTGVESYMVSLGGPGVGYHTADGIEYWSEDIA